MANKKRQPNGLKAIFLTGEFNKDIWFIISGASKHMTASKQNLIQMAHQLEIKEIIVANKTKLPVLFSGEVNIVTQVIGAEYEVAVRDVLYIPNLTTNLISVDRK